MDQKPQGLRVTAAQVVDAIAGETYTTLPSGRVTICEITLQNGFTVWGDSAVLDAANNDPEIGRKWARDRAIDEVYKYLGHLLRQRAYEEELRKR